MEEKLQDKRSEETSDLTGTCRLQRVMWRRLLGLVTRGRKHGPLPRKLT